MTTRRTVAKLPGTVSATALNSVAVTNIVSTRSRTSASANACGSRTVSSSRITHVPPVSSGTHTSKLIASKAGLARQANRVPMSSQPGSASRRTPASRTSTPLGRPVVPEVEKRNDAGAGSAGAPASARKSVNGTLRDLESLNVPFTDLR